MLDTYDCIKIYTKVKKVDIDGKEYNCKIGKHSIWIPQKELKLTWSYNGKIESYLAFNMSHNKEKLVNQSFNGNVFWDTESLKSIINEYMILRLLSKSKMTTEIGAQIYIRTVMYDHMNNDSMHCDCSGMLGYYMEDAEKQSEKGKFNIEDFKDMFLNLGIMNASAGAIGDLTKRDNVINGYLIDIRRTLWDMMTMGYIDNTIEKKLIEELTKKIYPSRNDIICNVESDGQFPYKKRRTPYQDYWLGGDYIKGTRKTLYRFAKFDMLKSDKELDNKSILDLGCCYGAMASEAYRRGARFVTGIDNKEEYIDLARKIAKYNKQNINYQHMELNNVDLIVKYVNNYYKGTAHGKPNIVFALSLWKHLKEKILQILKEIDFDVCFFESNNVDSQSIQSFNSSSAIEIEAAFKKYDLAYTRLGTTEDRSLRCLWSIKK